MKFLILNQVVLVVSIFSATTMCELPKLADGLIGVKNEGSQTITVEVSYYIKNIDNYNFQAKLEKNEFKSFTIPGYAKGLAVKVGQWKWYLAPISALVPIPWVTTLMEERFDSASTRKCYKFFDESHTTIPCPVI